MTTIVTVPRQVLGRALNAMDNDDPEWQNCDTKFYKTFHGRITYVNEIRDDTYQIEFDTSQYATMFILRWA